MVVFMKPATSIGTELFAAVDEPLHYKGEICLLLQGDEVAGIGLGLDLTKRDTQAKLKVAGLPWERGKASTGSALFSEFVTAPENLTQLGVELVVKDAELQKSDVSLMLYPLGVVRKELNQFLVLQDFDIVMNGTPAGMGAVQAGERFCGRVLYGEQDLISAEWLAQ